MPTFVSATTLAALMVLAVISGCATEREIAPGISAEARSGIELKKPIQISVFDGRSGSAKRDVVSPLKADLARIYGKNLLWSEYFSKAATGRVTLRIRIVTLGSSFGSRVVSSSAYAKAVSNAQFSASTYWGPVSGQIVSHQSVFAASFTGEGWWNGGAWIDLEIEDRRRKKRTKLTLPIAAEHRESNLWGYKSGDKAAKKAWEKVSAQLLRALDAVLRNVRDT